MTAFAIASRMSPLAMAQTLHVQAQLAGVHRRDGETAFPVLGLSTTGDQITDRALLAAGGKGLFTKELELALLESRARFAVHSMKDVPTQLPDGLEIAAILPREDPRDVLLARDGVTNIEDLPKGATLGTASIRRQAQALAIRLDLNIVLLRGNVDTRLSKLKSGEVDATFLARAGLNRLGRDEAKLEPVAIESMIPAPAQGCVGIEIRSDDDEARDLLLPLNDTKSAVAAICERGFLKALDGSCRTPIAAYACFNDGRIWLRAEALMPDGTQRWRDEVSAELNSDDRLEAERIGFDLGQSVKARGGETLAKIVEATG